MRFLFCVMRFLFCVVRFLFCVVRGLFCVVRGLFWVMRGTGCAFCNSFYTLPLDIRAVEGGELQNVTFLVRFYTPTPPTGSVGHVELQNDLQNDLQIASVCAEIAEIIKAAFEGPLLLFVLKHSCAEVFFEGFSLPAKP